MAEQSGTTVLLRFVDETVTWEKIWRYKFSLSGVKMSARGGFMKMNEQWCKSGDEQGACVLQ